MEMKGGVAKVVDWMSLPLLAYDQAMTPFSVIIESLDNQRRYSLCGYDMIQGYLDTQYSLIVPAHPAGQPGKGKGKGQDVQR